MIRQMANAFYRRNNYFLFKIIYLMCPLVMYILFTDIPFYTI